MAGSRRMVPWLLVATVGGIPGMATAQSRLGNYICYTAHVAGLQLESNGGGAAGGVFGRGRRGGRPHMQPAGDDAGGASGPGAVSCPV